MKPLYIVLCCLMAASALAQDIQYVNRDGKPSTKKKAFGMTVFTRVNDTCWERNYYKAGGPCLISVRYKDQDATVQHGRYVKFRRDGCADTIGFYNNGKKEGRWAVPGQNCRTLYMLEYANDKLIAVTDSTELAARRKRSRDSLLRLNPSDTSEIESEFPGGAKSWQQYLNRNFTYPKEAIDDETMGDVWVAFEVKTDGGIEAPFIWRSAGYYLDREAMRIIVKSARWEPARQFGKKVRSYKIQPVIFRLERG